MVHVVCFIYGLCSLQLLVRLYSCGHPPGATLCTLFAGLWTFVFFTQIQYTTLIVPDVNEHIMHTNVEHEKYISTVNTSSLFKVIVVLLFDVQT
jgi:hypothetical protein